MKIICSTIFFQHMKHTIFEIIFLFEQYFFLSVPFLTNFVNYSIVKG